MAKKQFNTLRDVDPKEIEKIAKLYYTKELAVMYEVSETSMARFLKKYDIEPKKLTDVKRTDTTRICSTCGKKLPLSEFQMRSKDKDKNDPFNYKSKCKDCESIRKILKTKKDREDREKKFIEKFKEEHPKVHCDKCGKDFKNTSFDYSFSKLRFVYTCKKCGYSNNNIKFHKNS